MVKMNLRASLKNNRFINKSVTRLKNLYFHDIKRYLGEISGIYRKYVHSPYAELEEYKDKYRGNRCFIVCTGPSLTFDDLGLIKNEYSYGMNSILKVFSSTEWRPTFYGIQDIHVYRKMENDVLNAGLQEVFVADDIVRDGLRIPSKAHIYPLNFYGHEYFNFVNPKFAFSDDITVNVYDGFSVTYSMIQIANYMGFKEIYLMGCDCSYAKEPEKQHFVSSGHVDPNAYLVGGLQNKAYMEAKKYCDGHDLRIFNATRGGYLEIFERVNLDEVVNVK